MSRYFDDEELKELPIGFQFIMQDSYFVNGQVLKQIKSNFYQNNKKQKLRIVHKPISKLYVEDAIL